MDFQADSHDLLLALVGIGFGVALVPALVARPATGIRFLEIARSQGLTRDLRGAARPPARITVRGGRYPEFQEAHTKPVTAQRLGP